MHYKGHRTAKRHVDVLISSSSKFKVDVPHVDVMSCKLGQGVVCMRLPYPERKQTKANQIQRDREPSIKGVYLIENNLLASRSGSGSARARRPSESRSGHPRELVGAHYSYSFSVRIPTRG